MIQIEVETVGAETIERDFKRARPYVFERWFATMRRHAFRAVRIWTQRYRSSPTTTPLATRRGTGALAASGSQITRKMTDGIESEIGLMRASARGHALRYGAVHEEGATIQARGKRLAIPLPTIRSPSGIAPPPRSFPNTFIIPGRSGQGVIMQRLGKGAIRPLFALRNQVTIPARPPGGAFVAAAKAVQSELDADLERDVIEVLGGGAQGVA